MTGIRREAQWYEQTAYDLMEGVWPGHGFETATIHPIAMIHGQGLTPVNPQDRRKV